MVPAAMCRDLSLVPEGFFQQHNIDARLGERVVSIDREQRKVRTDSGAVGTRHPRQSAARRGCSRLRSTPACAAAAPASSSQVSA